jgi:flagellar biosynthesis protein FliQ
METADIFQICHEAIYVLIIISAPVMMTALLVGLVIALFQAITQVQEATLTFVPKILAVFFVLALSMSFILQTLTDFNNRLHDRIVHIE